MIGRRSSRLGGVGNWHGTMTWWHCWLTTKVVPSNPRISLLVLLVGNKLCIHPALATHYIHSTLWISIETPVWKLLCGGKYKGGFLLKNKEIVEQRVRGWAINKAALLARTSMVPGSNWIMESLVSSRTSHGTSTMYSQTFKSLLALLVRLF
jgi:hypothetical protein